MTKPMELQPIDPPGGDKPSHGLVNVCPNCGTPVNGNFCSGCGQETDLGPQTIGEFFGGLKAQYLNPQGLLWKTLWTLFFSPGALTIAYVAGQRARYLRPLKLYLMASVVVFGMVQVFGLNLELRLYGEQGVHFLRSSRTVSVDESRGRGIGITPVQIILDHSEAPGVQRFRALSAEDRFTFLRARRAQYVSYFVLFLVPFLALTLGLFYPNRRRRYAEHLVFGLHCQTFLLFILLAEAKLPTILADALSFWVLAYFTMALKRVYGGTWIETLGRGFAISGLYFAIIFVMNLLLVFFLLAL